MSSLILHDWRLDGVRWPRTGGPQGDVSVLVTSQVDRAFRGAYSLAGVTGFRFHDLRHEHGSRLGDADVNLRKIARLMGHSTTQQTERYVHPDEAGLLATSESAAGPRTRIVPARLREVGGGGG